MAVHRRRLPTLIVFWGSIVILLSLTAVGCASNSCPIVPPNSPTSTPLATELTHQATPTFAAPPTPTPIPTKSWLTVLQKTPYPYSTPLPAPTSTVLDGIYVKSEPKEGTPVPCRRCPDYLPEGGLWRLNLDRGAYRIFHEVTRWYSLGSFTVSGDRLLLFNDPTCIDTVGIYEWELVAGNLRLAVVEDTCQVDRRGRSFANLAWAACGPPNDEAAMTDHWPRPAGCDTAE